MKIVISFLLLMALIVLSGMIVSVAGTLFPTGIVNAGPEGCPPGQGGDCICVKHRKTGKIMLMPGNSNAEPWEIIDMTYCIPKKDTEVPTKIVYPSNTPIQIPIPFTCTPSPVSTSSSASTQLPVTQKTPEIRGDQVQVTPQVIPTCDICSAFATMASVQVTDSAWRRR